MTPYWTSPDGAHVIYCGDCLDVLPTLPKLDSVITDPPYGEVTHKGARTNNFHLPRIERPKLINFDSITHYDLRLIMEKTNLRRWWVSFMEWRHIAALEQCPPSNLEFIRMGIWVKPNGAPQFTGDRPATGWEGVGIFHRPGKKRWNGGGHHAVWTCNTSSTVHPTGKPETLVTRLVSLFTEPGELILDPFMGSGTTGIACIRTGRRFIGIEKNEKYFALARERMTRELSQPNLPGVGPEMPRQTEIEVTG